MSPEGHPLKNKEVVRALETANDIELPMDPQFYERLHDKIMARVEETEIKKVPGWFMVMARPKKYLRNHWKGWLGTTMSLITAAYLGLQISVHVSKWIPESHTFKVVQNEKELLQNALGSPEDFSTSLINYQSHEDFVVDVASQRSTDLDLRSFF